MPHLETLLTYTAVVLALFLIPGPAVLLVLARATTGGRRVGVATGMGVATGDLVHTAMAALGLSAVLMTSALAFSLVKYAGAAYLIYLGIRALMERGGDLSLGSARLVDASLAYRQAVLAEMLNPTRRCSSSHSCRSSSAPTRVTLLLSSPCLASFSLA